MRETERKRLFRKLFYSKTSAFLILILVLIFARLAFRSFLQAEEKEALLQKEIIIKDDLDAREKTLQNDLSRFTTEDGLEAAIRSQYNMAKEGEGLIIIIDEKEMTSPEFKSSWWQRFKNFLF